MAHIASDHFVIKVSSVLNKDVKQFGKQYLTDGKPDTCWNSDQGNHQWISCQFKRQISVTQINIEFQGGFAANNIALTFSSDGRVISEQTLYARNENNLQHFKQINAPFADSVTLRFDECTDFFGRIIVYNLELYGHFQ